jgi:hypothetical protein
LHKNSFFHLLSIFPSENETVFHPRKDTDLFLLGMKEEHNKRDWKDREKLSRFPIGSETRVGKQVVL